MTPDNAIAQATALVLNEGLSISAAAKRLEIPISTLRLSLIVNPDYVKAKAEGKLHSQIDVKKLDVAALREHPAVLAVVRDKKTFAAAAAEHGMQGPTLHRWVNTAYPEHRKSPEAPNKRRTFDDVAEPFVDVLLGYLKDTANKLDTPPEKLLKLMAKRLETTT